MLYALSKFIIEALYPAPALQMRVLTLTCKSYCRKNAETAHLISAAVGANFAMYLATMHANSSAGQPASNVER